MLIVLLGMMMLFLMGKMIVIALRLSWGMTKIVFSVVLLPVLVIAFVIANMIPIALMLLVIFGVRALIIQA